MNRRLARNEIGQRGREIYETRLRAVLEPEHDGQFVAIDVESAEFEVADEAQDASDRLWERCPGAQILIERVGHPSAFHVY